MYYYPTYENYLAHYGIKGMKWGVRRYQNADGTLTAAGQTRLDEYKAREKAEAIKRGKNYKAKHTASVAKLKQRIAEQKENGDGKVDAKTKKDYKNAKDNLKRVKEITKDEIKRIENMTFDEMRSEKMKSAIELGVYVTGIVAPLPLSDVLAVAIVGDPFDNKTKRRTGRSYRGLEKYKKVNIQRNTT